MMRRIAAPHVGLLLGLLLLPASLASSTDSAISGLLQDPSGGTIGDARITLLSAQQAILGMTNTNLRGQFRFEQVPPGSYVVISQRSGFATTRTPVAASQSATAEITIVMQIQPLQNQVSVTADAGAAVHPSQVIQAVNIIDEEAIRQRARTVVAEAANEESGLALQRTSPTIAGIYVRGLTGSKVNVFLDGVRYSTGAVRGGINTFLSLMEPSGLQAIEVLRGPSSAQYGSDALGGSVQLLSRAPNFSSSGSPSIQGSMDTYFNSADAGLGSNVSSTYAKRSFGVAVNLAGRRVSTLRPGGGLDSHSAVTRFLGLRSDALMHKRLPDTAFTQYGGNIKINWALTNRSQIVTHYSRSQQDGGKRYDQLLGGDGNLIADLRNLMLDLWYVRYEKFNAGWFDYVSLAYSFNSQREERVNQGGNGNSRSSITHEYERTNANGLQALARKQWTPRQTLLAGADFYHERVHSPSYGVNPATQVATTRRGRIPDNALYRNGGVYLQNTFEAVPNRLQLTGAIRGSGHAYRARAMDSPLVGGSRLWPDDSLKVWDLTFRAGVIAAVFPNLKLYASISRGFHAPNVTDLGTHGLTGSGFEVAAPEVSGMGAMIGSSAASNAVSTGRPVAQVKPETSLNYEAGIRLSNKRISTEVSIFVNDLKDSLTKQTLILPAGAVGKELAGQIIMAQSPNGAVFVPAASNPVLVRANLGDSRIFGVESRLDWWLSSALSWGSTFTYLRASDPATGLPPNIEGGTPAPDGNARIRYQTVKQGFWIEPYIHVAARQSRLSSLDLEDRRTGATRTRSSIRSFFLNGATFRGYVSPGPDGIQGTADDVLKVTGETLSQVQDRILGQSGQAAPLFAALPGYVTFGVRTGFRIAERQDLLIDFFNIGDRNCRGISWGMDAPGRGVSIRYRISF